MIDKAKVRTMSLLGRLEKNGIDRDIATSKLFVQEFLFKKLFIRNLILFLISFSTIFILNFDVFLLGKSTMGKEYLINVFTIYILLSMFICFIYDVIASFVLIDEYKKIQARVERYLKGLESVGIEYEEA